MKILKNRLVGCERMFKILSRKYFYSDLSVRKCKIFEYFCHVNR